MKILQLGKFYPPDTGGIEQVMFNITETLNERGIQCDVLCSNNTCEYQEEKIKNYTVYRTKSFGKLFRTSISVQMIFKLCEIISNYNIVHIHHPDPMATLALFFAHTGKQKIIVHWHSDIIKQKITKLLYLPLQNWLLKRTEQIIVTTSVYKEQSEDLRKFKNKCVIVPIGIDASKLKCNKGVIKKIRNKYKNKKIVFSLGRLIYYKGFEYLIRAAQYIDDDFVILIAGSGPLYNKLKKLIVEKNLSNKVWLLGRVADNMLGNYYSTCNIFCLPAVDKSEAFGVVQVEAMSFSKPIITTDIEGSGVSFVNKHGVSGLNVPTRDEHALARAFESVISDDIVYKNYCKNARKRFEKLFTHDRMVTKLIKLYERILPSAFTCSSIQG